MILITGGVEQQELSFVACKNGKGHSCFRKQRQT
jgi:hypothetical protein